MARFVITDPQDKTQIFEITASTVSIGRVESNDLVLNHRSVSRHHARLNVLPGGTTILIDLDSLNGTYVNGRQVQEHPLQDQDRVNIGMFELRYEFAHRQPLHVEAASGSGDFSRLVSVPKLATALKVPDEAGGASLRTTEERLKALEQENKALKLLVGVGNTLASILTADEIMHRVMELVFQMDHVERGFVMLLDEKGGFRPAVLMYKDDKLKNLGRGVALSRSVIERVTTERLPLLIRDVEEDERFSKSQSLRISGIRSAMCAPLIYKDRLFGLFYVDCLSRPYAFSKEELSIFSVVAAEAAISFDNARAHEELSRRALERRALERFLDSAIVDKILASPDQVHLGGENQIATILFSDIRGFTRMSERMEPHQVVELLNEYFSEMTELIFENGGTLDKYLGDGIMAIFGAPLAKRDDSRRAVKTAIEMQRAMTQLNCKWQERGQNPLQIGVGVNTGSVTAGNIGSAKRMDYTVIGDAVNLASRLCANAAGGQILISESTFAEISGHTPARRLAPIRVKGKEAPVEVYEILWDGPVPGSRGVIIAAQA
jgi:adenylate cyclase